jgi:hypothetical protein
MAAVGLVIAGLADMAFGSGSDSVHSDAGQDWLAVLWKTCYDWTSQDHEALFAYRAVADCWGRSSLQSVHLHLGSQLETAGNCQIYLAGDAFDGVADFERTSNQERR